MFDFYKSVDMILENNNTQRLYEITGVFDSFTWNWKELKPNRKESRPKLKKVIIISI